MVTRFTPRGTRITRTCAGCGRTFEFILTSTPRKFCLECRPVHLPLGERVCACGATIPAPKGRGRPPLRCEDCRTSDRGCQRCGRASADHGICLTLSEAHSGLRDLWRRVPAGL